MSRLIGYARVSNEKMALDSQIAALKAAGCEKIFSDCGTTDGGIWRGLDDAQLYLQPGDTLVVCSRDRLSRFPDDLENMVESLENRQIGLRVLKE